MFVDYEVPFRGHCLITGSEIKNDPPNLDRWFVLWKLCGQRSMDQEVTELTGNNCIGRQILRIIERSLELFVE